MFAFRNCKTLSKISISTEQSIAVSEDAFDLLLFKNCLLEVPAGRTNNYNHANIWREFDCIIGKIQNSDLHYNKNKALKQVI
jgi:hypothetical protein